MKRKSTFSLLLSTLVIAVSIALCSILFSVAAQIRRSVENEMAKSGAANALEVIARSDREVGAPWSAAPIGATNPVQALNRLVTLLREQYGAAAVTSIEPFWLAPGWVYLYLAHPDLGGKAVSIGLALTSPTDPEGVRIEPQKLAGAWITDPDKLQLVLPETVADQLWKDVLFVGETAWIGLTDHSTCAEVEIVGIYAQTQRGYCYASRTAATVVQNAMNNALRKEKGQPALAPSDTLSYQRAWVYFRDRSTLLKARRLVEEKYKFEAKSPFDKFAGKIRLVTTAQLGAWTVLLITLGAACGSIFCTFLAWVSRRRYEIALLKAQGSGHLWIAATYLTQSGAAGILAGITGLLISSRLVCPLLTDWLNRAFALDPPIHLAIPLDIQLLMLVTSLAITLIAALIPAVIAARQQPWEILREAG
ncbi:MAG: ABC transporter permease [Spartobacteria bacterium]|nr:ABC transporter permease [Spartobacteria bacterium]